nr:acetolactate synthase catalytic subunit [Amycolatopsis jejuensis]
MVNTVADVIAATLRRHGAEVIFGQSNPTALLLAAERRGIRQILYRTENAGGVMADGYARAANRISVLAVQNGPAAALAVAPMAEALKASIPMLVLVQDVPAAHRDRNAFQEMDHVALFSAVSKWTRRIDAPSRAADAVDLAVTAANSGRPGPVVLLLPKDVLHLPAEQNAFPRTADLGTFPLDRPRPARAAVTRAADLLAAARAPVVIAGGGIHASGAATALARLQHVARLPVATTSMGKGAVDETGPLSLGVVANLTGERGRAHHYRRLLAEADVVLLAGTRTNENGTDGWDLTSADATYLHIDVDGVEIGRNYEAVRLVGDAQSALTDLTDELQLRDLTRRQEFSTAFETRIKIGRELHRTSAVRSAEPEGTPIAPERVLAEIDALLRPDDIVTADASYSSSWVAALLTARRAGQRFLLPRGIAGLGWGLPLAMGAKLARPGQRVLALVGDGGFAHGWSEIETAVREKIAVTVVVLNNAVLGAQRHTELLTFGETTTAVDFAPVDHAAVAQAAGAIGVVVTEPADLHDALATALDAATTTVLDVHVDPDAVPPLRGANVLELPIPAIR